MACSKEALRIVLWMSWVCTWLFNSVFVAITLISFTQLWEASSVYLPVQGSHIYSDRSWRAPMASCILSALLVIGYDVMSCVTLIKKSINRAGPGFGFGFIVAFSFCLAFFLLLCGLVLDSFRPKVQSLADFDWTFNNTRTPDFVWKKYDSQTFVGAEVFALINFVVLLIFSVILVSLQAGVSEQLGIESTQYAPLEAVPMAMAGSTAQDGYADGMEQGVAGQGYGYVGDDQTDIQNSAQPYGAQGSSSMRVDGNSYAHPTDYQGYTPPGPAAAASGGSAYYGQAQYGSTATADTYTYDGAAAGQHAGDGLLGGQSIGSAPAAPQQSQGYVPPAAGYTYQQF